jgi:hypothetical protein
MFKKQAINIILTGDNDDGPAIIGICNRFAYTEACVHNLAA